MSPEEYEKILMKCPIELLINELEQRRGVVSYPNTHHMIAEYDEDKKTDHIGNFKVLTISKIKE